MEQQQRVFLFLIAAGFAIFILLQQGSQLPANHLKNSASKWGYNSFINEIPDNASDTELERWKRKEKLKSFLHKFHLIDKFAIFDGEKQSRVLILAYFRSGSSFVGDLLQQNWKSFYTFEPLHYMTRQRRIDGDHNITEATDLLNDIYNCDFQQNSPYIKWVKNNTFLIRWNRFFWNICKFRAFSLCYDNNFLSQVCLRSKFNIIKSVRLRMKDLKTLLSKMDPDTNLKIIYLVRDPRGIYNSRKSMEWCNNNECKNISNICAEMREDLSEFDRLKLKLGANLILSRYEDISSDPFAQAKQLFQSINFDFSPSVQRFLRTHTNSYKEKDSKNPYSTYRTNSTLTALQWTKELNQTEIEYARNVCRDVLERLNYQSYSKI